MKNTKNEMIKEHEVFSIRFNKESYDSEKGIATIVGLSEGWSKNGNFYSKEVAESLSSHLMKRKKIFLNHVTSAPVGRDLGHWAATVVESWGADGKAYAKIRFTGNPNSNWLVKEAMDNPEEIQFSIDATIRAYEGEQQGKKGTIVESIVGLRSLDIVDYASAGGVLKSIQASEHAVEDTNLSFIDSLKESMVETFNKKLDKNVAQSEIWSTFYLFLDMLAEVKWEYDAENRKEQIDALVSEFLSKFSNLKFVVAYENEIDKKGGANMDYKELKENHADLVAKVIEEYEAESKKAEQITALEAEKESLISKVSKFESDLSSTKEALDAIKAELNTTKESLEEKEIKLGEFELKEKVSERKQVISNLIKESAIGSVDVLPELLQNSLMNLDKDEDAIKKEIKSYESLLAKSTKVNGAGVTYPVDSKESDGSKTAKAPSDDEVIKLFKNLY